MYHPTKKLFRIVNIFVKQESIIKPSFEIYLNRKFQFYSIDHPFYEHNNNELEYLIFDCIAMYGRSFANERRLSQRFIQCQQFMNKYLENVKKDIQNKNMTAVPIVLRVKKYWKANEVDKLLNCIRYENGEQRMMV